MGLLEKAGIYKGDTQVKSSENDIQEFLLEEDKIWEEEDLSILSKKSSTVKGIVRAENIEYISKQNDNFIEEEYKKSLKDKLIKSRHNIEKTTEHESFDINIQDNSKETDILETEEISLSKNESEEIVSELIEDNMFNETLENEASIIEDNNQLVDNIETNIKNNNSAEDMDIRITEIKSMQKDEETLVDTKSKNNLSEDLQDSLDKKSLDLYTLFEIGKELNSTHSVKELLDIILFTCMGKMNTGIIAVYLYLDKKFVLSASKGVDEIPKEFSISDNEMNAIKELSSSAFISEVFNIENPFKDSEFTLIVPLIEKDNTTGIFLMGKKVIEEDYSEDDRDFLFILGSFASIALENAKLLEDLKETNIQLDKRLKELQTLYEISRVINSSSELDEVLELIKETITTGFGINKYAIMLKDRKSRLFKLKSGIGLSDSAYENFIFDEEDVLSGVITSGESLILDIKSDPSILKGLDDNDRIGIEKILAVPLQAAENDLGIMLLLSLEKGEFNNDNSRLFSIIASQIAPPIYTSQLIAEEKSQIRDPFTPFEEFLETKIEEATKYDAPLTITKFSILNYKRFNNIFGKENAKKLISQIYMIIKKGIRDIDIVYRYGRNSFILISPNILLKDIQDNIEKIKENIKNISFDDIQPLSPDKVKKIAILVAEISAEFPSDGNIVSILDKID